MSARLAWAAAVGILATAAAAGCLNPQPLPPGYRARGVELRVGVPPRSADTALRGSPDGALPDASSTSR